MPNGISCAFFAGRNLIYGTKEKNVFKEGIAGAQTTRTIDSAVQSATQAGMVNVPGAGGISKAAALARKIVYPLVVMSGIYNTVKADDKVKTGANQAAGITTMIVSEQFAEKGLKAVEQKLKSTAFVKNHKAAGIGLYIAKGLCYVAASMTGFNIGSKTSDKIVDKIRETNSDKELVDINLDAEEPNVFESIDNFA